MDFVLNHVVKFENIHIAHGDFLIKTCTRTAVVKLHLAILGKTGLFKLILYFVNGRARKRRNYRLVIELMRGKSEVKLKYLPKVHTRRNAERSQNDINRRAIGKVRHILNRQDPRNDSL